MLQVDFQLGMILNLLVQGRDVREVLEDGVTLVYEKAQDGEEMQLDKNDKSLVTTEKSWSFEDADLRRHSSTSRLPDGRCFEPTASRIS